MNKLTQARLKELFNYDEHTGIFTRIKRIQGGKFGVTAGVIVKDGCRAICIDYKIHLPHRLAWFYVYGDFPVGEIDHKDGDPSNNSISNLRLATRSQNSANTKVRKSSKTGFKGVELVSKVFRARIRFAGVKHCLGYHATAEAAHNAYIEKAIELHGDFFKNINVKPQ